ncbi:hypothetical protein CEN50_22450 [Fischerella thermalis CCMEE 5268]|uniref:Uncharacterized protein n=1 Tax=Fischerella thermalis CCMEE 5268 TaxID=2019662 RepID=A0A2N6KAT8_9CYAN|nr:hypothetical protein CEN50_22450 [Fischerella thermalis CCMEE 5268]
MYSPARKSAINNIKSRISVYGNTIKILLFCWRKNKIAITTASLMLECSKLNSDLFLLDIKSVIPILDFRFCEKFVDARRLPVRVRRFPPYSNEKPLRGYASTKQRPGGNLKAFQDGLKVLIAKLFL